MDSRTHQLSLRNCSTTPVSIKGAELSPPLEVERGVCQGCPLSSILFNLVFDPLLKRGTLDISISLGDMDDIAVIFDDPSEVEQTLADMEQLASTLGVFLRQELWYSQFSSNVQNQCWRKPPCNQRRSLKISRFSFFKHDGRHWSMFR